MVFIGNFFFLFSTDILLQRCLASFKYFQIFTRKEKDFRGKKIKSAF